MPKFNLFTKIVSLILIMLVPIIWLYFYSNMTSTTVLSDELNQSSMNQLAFFQSQVNTNIDLLTIWPYLLTQDPDISNLKDIFESDEYLDLQTITLVKRIQTKLSIQESSSNWRSRLYIYSPFLGRTISDNSVSFYDVDELQGKLKPGWQVLKTVTSAREYFVFSRFATSPFLPSIDSGKANLIIEVQFDSDQIQDMLDKFKNDGRRDPFYYKPDTGVIYNRTVDRQLTDQLVERLSEHELQTNESRTIELNGQPYMVNIVHSSAINWYLIDYMQLQDIFMPIKKTNQLFYFSVACMLLMSSVIAYMLYAQVQVPMKQLMINFQKLKNGDYSARMSPRGNSEFSFVFTRFNLMVEQIQELFEKVYMEKIHVREARLKQLQSQINPHFFYNCVSFISSMAKLKDHKAVVAMAENLSLYYRYATRQERELVQLTEELEFVMSYLHIQQMRTKRLEYAIELPVRMKKLEIPPLLLQPIVENAVLHGIELYARNGFIRISGEWNGGVASVIVEDNGKGMTVEAIAELGEKLEAPMDEEMGCGLWNVHQRMRLRFGDTAGVDLSISSTGGLRVTLSWAPVITIEQEESGHDRSLIS